MDDTHKREDEVLDLSADPPSRSSQKAHVTDDEFYALLETPVRQRSARPSWEHIQACRACKERWARLSDAYDGWQSGAWTSQRAPAFTLRLQRQLEGLLKSAPANNAPANHRDVPRLRLKRARTPHNHWSGRAQSGEWLPYAWPLANANSASNWSASRSKRDPENETPSSASFALHLVPLVVSVREPDEGPLDKEAVDQMDSVNIELLLQNPTQREPLAGVVVLWDDQHGNAVTASTDDAGHVTFFDAGRGVHHFTVQGYENVRFDIEVRL